MTEATETPKAADLGQSDLEGVVSPPPSLDKAVRQMHWVEALDAVVRCHNNMGDLREQAFANFERREFKDATARVILLRAECEKMVAAFATLLRLSDEG